MEQDKTELSALDELDVQGWNQYWAEVERRTTPLFARSDAHHRAMTYLTGLLSPAERKQSWQLAEISGDGNPYGLQNLLGRACWNADALRGQRRGRLRPLRGTELDRAVPPHQLGNVGTSIVECGARRTRC